MRSPRTLALLLLLLVSCREATPAKAPAGSKPELFLLTPLPLVWSEQFGLDQPGSPALGSLEQDYKVTPVDLPSEVPEGGLLLAAQPRALPAEELVKLDKWVRSGGRMLLLADPMLEWPSALPLGDPGRAPVAFPDTGLLQHWGLRLDAPEARGPLEVKFDDRTILAASPGRLAPIGPDPVTVEHAGRARLAVPVGQEIALIQGCMIDDGHFVARCRLGKGQAIVIADADFLNLGPGGLDGPTERNLAALVSQVSLLSR